MFIGRTDAEAETPVLWPPDAKSWLIWKDPDAGRDWGQEEKGTTEDEMVGWHNWLKGHWFGWTPVVGDGQGGLVCYGSWGCKELDMTERLNWRVNKGFPDGSDVKESSFNAGDLGSIPGLGSSLGEGNGNPLQYSSLENPMDKGAWRLQSMGLQRVRHDWASSLSLQRLTSHCIECGTLSIVNH